jgi:hypothetical protein
MACTSAAEVRTKRVDVHVLLVAVSGRGLPGSTPPDACTTAGHFQYDGYPLDYRTPCAPSTHVSATEEGTQPLSTAPVRKKRRKREDDDESSTGSSRKRRRRSNAVRLVVDGIPFNDTVHLYRTRTDLGKGRRRYLNNLQRPPLIRFCLRLLVKEDHHRPGGRTRRSTVPSRCRTSE